MAFVAAEPDRSLVASSSPPTRRRPSGTADLPGKRGGERTLGPRTERARELRNNMTNTEWRVWSRIRGKALMGFKFRRQLAIGDYFVDFACVAARLAVEIDGPQHEEESDRRKLPISRLRGFELPASRSATSTTHSTMSLRQSFAISSPPTRASGEVKNQPKSTSFVSTVPAVRPGAVW